jgi:hypothetical protein
MWSGAAYFDSIMLVVLAQCLAAVRPPLATGKLSGPAQGRVRRVKLAGLLPTEASVGVVRSLA